MQVSSTEVTAATPENVENVSDAAATLAPPSSSDSVQPEVKIDTSIAQWSLVLSHH